METLTFCLVFSSGQNGLVWVLEKVLLGRGICNHFWADYFTLTLNYFIFVVHIT
uniref:Uncharacterized protein n=1 Tax=Anguilla anguilla TaxID=7936 RepID=A0A0E9WSY9_ANGAN